MLSLAHMPNPLCPDKMAECLGGQAGHIKAWLSLLSPGLKFSLRRTLSWTSKGLPPQAREDWKWGGGVNFQHRQEVSQDCREGLSKNERTPRRDHMEGTGVAAAEWTARTQLLCGRHLTWIGLRILTPPHQGGAHIIKALPVGKLSHPSDNQLNPRPCLG